MYYVEVRSGTLFVWFVVTLNRRQLFFSSSQVSRTSTRGSSVLYSIPRICAKQTLKEILQNFMLRLSCCARGADISWRWPRWTHTTNTGGWRRGAQWGQSSSTPALPPSLLVEPSIAVVFAGPIQLSVSLKARSTLGRLKLLLPKGPTIPAATPAKSVGFRDDAPRGSLSDFFEYSS